MPDTKNINDNALNELLKQLHLEENSFEVNPDVAGFILDNEYNVKIDPKKEAEFLGRFDKKEGKSSFNTSFFILLVIILISVSFALQYVEPENKIVSIHQEKIISKTPTNISENNITSPASDIQTRQTLPDTFGKIALIPITLEEDSIPVSVLPIRKTEIQQDDLPILTEPDKLKYSRVKQMMLQKIIKFDKNFYTHVEAGKIDYKSETVITEPFYMKNTSVSNLEYKTFLADLIVQKRSQDYFTAQVKNDNWKINKNMDIDYFQDERYNDFPVVNISPEGMKLYCNWLEEETKQFISKNRLKTKPIQVRLPVDIDWIYAARAGYVRISYEQGYNTLFDETEGLVNKSFTRRAELITKRVKRSDSLYSVFTVNKYGMSDKEINDIFNRGLSYYPNIIRDTLYSERMKLHAKAGSVSQYVIESKTNTIWLTGITWKTKAEYQKLVSEFKNSNASPFVGFRVIIIDTGDSEYKNPFW